MAPIEGLLIGSRSLSTHVSLDRDPADWDILIRPSLFESLKLLYPCRWLRDDHYYMMFQGEAIELHVVPTESSSSNADLLNIAALHNYPTIQTPIGLMYNACKSMHKLLKLSSYGILHKHKNYRDLDLLIHTDVLWPDLLKKRRAETLNRSKREAFFKDNVSRFIAHDTLHCWVAEALKLSQPTFRSLVSDEVQVSREIFESTSFTIQSSAFVEEAMVLALERWFIPNVRKHNVFRLWDKYLQASTSQDPCIRWLDRLCCEGALLDHPQWLAQWGHNHYLEVKYILQRKLSVAASSMPKEFWHFIDEVKTGRVRPD